jgi:hypothetical protein
VINEIRTVTRAMLCRVDGQVNARGLMYPALARNVNFSEENRKRKLRRLNHARNSPQ